jgi:ABC-type polysaccharide/polyol phosphate export permease
MAGVINSLRSVLISGTVADPTHLIISLISAVILFIVGMLYFRRTERFFADIL